MLFNSFLFVKIFDVFLLFFLALFVGRVIDLGLGHVDHLLEQFILCVGLLVDV